MSGELSISKFGFNNISLDVIVANNSDDENKTYFFGSKVASILGYKKPDDAVRRHCRRSVELSHLMGANQKGTTFHRTLEECFEGQNVQPHTSMIPEFDVYRLVMNSKNLEAERFQDFVYDELLPSIRKFGEYPPPSANTRSPRRMIGYDIGDHNDRIKLFGELKCDCGYMGNLSTIDSHHECVNNEQRKELRFQTKTESDLLKSNPHKEAGRKGGISTRNKWRKLEKEVEELRGMKKGIGSLTNDITEEIFGVLMEMGLT